MRRTLHSSSPASEWTAGGKKRPVRLADFKSPRESQWMVALSNEREKKPGEKKKSRRSFPRSGQIALVCDTPAVACEREGAPSLFRRQEFSFRNDYRPSPATTAGQRRRGGIAPLSFSVTVRNYKGESAFKDYEEDLSSSINKHNCPRSWRGRNSSWINLRATAISPAALAALIRRLQSFPSYRESRLSPPRRSLSLEGPPCRGRAIWRLSTLCWFYFPSFANSGISTGVIVRGIIIRRGAACCSAAWNIGSSNRSGSETKRISRRLPAAFRVPSFPSSAFHLHLSRCPMASTIPSYDF